MQTLFRLLVVVALLKMPAEPRLWAEDNRFSFTPQQLSSAIAKNGLLKQRLYSIQSFDSGNGEIGIAILSASHAGWRITVLRRIPSGFRVAWQSGRMPDDIAVSGSNHFVIRSLEDHEQVVQFSGCAAHACGGKSPIFGVLLYSPRSNQVFFAHYRSAEDLPLTSFGSLQFSENVETPGQDKYKRALKSAMLEMLGK